MDTVAAAPANGSAGRVEGRPLARVAVANFRSIGYLDVTLPNITILTGRNGSGKSNIIDVFRFVKQAHYSGLESAIRDRKGIERIRRHSQGHPFNITIRMDFIYGDDAADVAYSGSKAVYVLQISSGPAATFYVNREQAVVYDRSGKVVSGFNFQDRRVSVYGKSRHLRGFDGSIDLPNDRLYLRAVGFSPEIFMLSLSLDSLDVYNLDPSAIRNYQSHDPGDVLAPNGENLASVVKKLRRDAANDCKIRILKYLRAISPEVEDFGCEESGSSDVLYFDISHTSPGAHQRGSRFRVYPSNISDGSLRALAVLVAMFVQPRGPRFEKHVLLLEEPETALHPGAAAVLMDAILAISEERQVILTTHSPSLLSHDVVSPHTLFGVSMHNGSTQIDAVDVAARDALTEQLFSAGELLQKEQLFSDAIPQHNRVDPNRLFVAGIRPRSEQGRKST